MSEWQKVKIGDVMSHRKEAILIDDAVEYKLCRVQLHRRGVVLRNLQYGAEIKTKKQYPCKKDDFIFAEMDSKLGGYGVIPEELEGAIVSSHYYLFEVNQKKLLVDFLKILLKTQVIQDQIKPTGSTNYASVRPKEFLNFTLLIPDVKTQHEIVIKFQNFQKKYEKVSTKNTFQQSHLALLRQQILQDAISGKLTADWRAENPDTEPASKLLNQIKTEKEKLVAEKKIKKEKPLPKIATEEVPFELPEGWEWCRLGEIVIFSENNNIHSNLNENEIVNYVDIDAVNNKTFSIENVKEKKVKDLSSRARRVLSKGDIVYSLVRPYLNNIAIVQENKPNYIGSTGFAVFSGIIVINDFLFNALLSDYIRKLYLKFLSGFNSPSITHDQFKNTAIPLPPRAEQRAIVAKVERLMKLVSQLEEKIAQNANSAETLMQAFLGEVFRK